LCVIVEYQILHPCGFIMILIFAFRVRLKVFGLDQPYHWRILAVRKRDCASQPGNNIPTGISPRLLCVRIREIERVVERTGKLDRFFDSESGVTVLIFFCQEELANGSAQLLGFPRQKDTAKALVIIHSLVCYLPRQPRSVISFGLVTCVRAEIRDLQIYEVGPRCKGSISNILNQS